MIYIVDENVPATANDFRIDPPKTPQADEDCKIACIEELVKIAKGVVALDEDGEILDRYRAKLHYKGTPGSGDAFFRHLSDRQGDPRYVKKISLSKDGAGEFTDFPTAQELQKFDHNDRIYIALANASDDDSVILNAVDSDYKQFSAALKSAGIAVKELCPQCLK